MKFVTLNNGASMPILGLGTWKSKVDEVENAVKAAIDAGYRHLDCAFAYNNEAEVGRAIKEKIAEGKVKREDLFIVSKLWNTRHRPEDVLPSLKESLQLLGLDYLDLYLVHWPIAFKPGAELVPFDDVGNILYEDVDIVENWKAMEKCVHEGLTKSIGISNYNSEQTQRLLDNSCIKPAVNQVEIHPYFTQEKLVKFCQDRGVAITAYSPLGSADRPWASPNEPLLVQDPQLKAVADKYNKTPAQVIIRWLIQRNLIVIPKSANADRIAENFNVFDFELSADDMQTINNLNKDMRLVHPVLHVNGKRVDFLGDLTTPNTPFKLDF